MSLKKQILVVEDNFINREILTGILAEQYTVLTAENGQEALDLLRTRKDDVALILLDVMMPVMDGYTFLERAKADAELALIPVIVTTQNDSEEDEIAALEHGATDFAPKPYRPQIILHRVASLISLRENAAMVNQFRYDRLTGVYSKAFFCQQAQELMHQHPERAYTIICSDIENFKLYNDVFGVPAGDRLLQETAEMLRELMGGDGLCGRYGADRFMLLRSQERRTADYDRFAAAGEAKLDRTKNTVMKWGVYEVTDAAVSVEQMCDRALLAANSIRGRYNTHVAVYDDALRSKLLREQRITDSMEEGLRQGQFTVYFQPKFSLADDRLAGAEALVRWVHPEMGFLSPGEFIPLFEKNGFITQMDMYVWEQSCAMLQDWQSRGLAVVPVSVNVSRADIYRTDVPEVLLGLVRRYGVEPALLHLEITESAYTEDPGQIIDTMGRLRELGFIIEMDDFGSGYSSLNMLNQMRIDILKLDMKFIQSETAKPLDQGILRFVVELAHWMNLSVVAEGVETRDQLEHIRETGCDYVQGYFFAKPMPGAEFERYLREEPSQAIKGRADALAAHSLLVADEDETYRKLVRDTFAGQYQVLEAASGAEALTCIGAHERDDTFVVILSMTLPEQGAETVLRAVQESPTLWRVPVLATMPQEEALETRALELSADDFLKKPHTQEGLRKRLGLLAGFSAHQARERALQDEACRDYLTGLLNRRGFYAAIDALRQEDLPVALYLFDLDDLKRVNDGYGHDKGDELLTAFGELLRKRTRNGDILCRYGGDEFVVILRRAADRAMVEKKGAEICGGIGEYPLPGGLHASCSAGAVLCKPGERPSAMLLERADKALYRAKQQGKGVCCLWEEPERP